MARICLCSKSLGYKHTSWTKLASKRTQKGPIKVWLLKWELNMSLMSFLDKSWQLCWIIWSLSVNAIQDTKVLYMQRKQAAPCHLLPLESLLLNVIYNLFMHSAKYVKKGEKILQNPVLKTFQTQDWLLLFFTCHPLIFNLHMDKMSAELSRNIWMLWYLTNLIGTANEPKDGACIIWLLLQPSPNEYK